jgi:hypothetical protein
MAETNFDKVAGMVQAFNDAEKRRLRDLLDIWLAPQGQTPTEDEVDQQMLRDGILDHVPPPITDTTPWENRRLIEVKGKPLSETIIEERR